MAVSVAEISKNLGGINFPVSKQNLIEHARGNNASQEMIEILQSMVEREYGSMAEVQHEFGQVK